MRRLQTGRHMPKACLAQYFSEYQEHCRLQQVSDTCLTSEYHLCERTLQKNLGNQSIFMAKLVRCHAYVWYITKPALKFMPLKFIYIKILQENSLAPEFATAN
jgi:hypothetical protein